MKMIHDFVRRTWEDAKRNRKKQKTGCEVDFFIQTLWLAQIIYLLHQRFECWRQVRSENKNIFSLLLSDDVVYNSEVACNRNSNQKSFYLDQTVRCLFQLKTRARAIFLSVFSRGVWSAQKSFLEKNFVKNSVHQSRLSNSQFSRSEEKKKISRI